MGKISGFSLACSLYTNKALKGRLTFPTPSKNTPKSENFQKKVEFFLKYIPLISLRLF
jgi:hypothetical protein